MAKSKKDSELEAAARALLKATSDGATSTTGALFAARAKLAELLGPDPDEDAE